MSDLSQRLLNYTFTTYKSNVAPTLSPSHHLTFIQNHLANYLYNKYLTSNNDLIIRFKSPSDIKLKLKLHTLNSVTYLLITSSYLISSQLIAWIPTSSRSDFNTLVLIKSPIPSFLIKCLQSMDHSPPLVLSKKTLSNDNLTSLINSLSQQLQFSYIQIAYETPLQSDSLKHVTIELAESDISKLTKDKDEPLVSSINNYFEGKTGIKLTNLPIFKVTSNHLVIYNDGKFKLLNSSVDIVECLTTFDL